MSWVQMVLNAMILFASEEKVQKKRALSAAKGTSTGLKSSWAALAISLAISRVSLILSVQSQITADLHLARVSVSAFVSLSSPLAKSFRVSHLLDHGFGFWLVNVGGGSLLVVIGIGLG